MKGIWQIGKVGFYLVKGKVGLIIRVLGFVIF